MEEISCLWIWEQDTDYVLCNWDSDLLPTLYQKDEIRFLYNQYKYSWSYVSCTIFAAAWMYSDLTNYEFSYDELKEIDDTSYNNPEYSHIRLPWKWWYVKDAVDHVRKYVNGRKDLVEKYWKVASYRISKYSEELIESVLDKLYTIDGNMCPTASYNQDKADWMIDGTDFWKNTNWHSIDIIKNDGQLSVKDSSSKNQIYGLKHKLSQISNFWSYFYVYTLVKEDNIERVKKLNEIKAKIVNWVDINSELWHLSGSEVHKNKLHDMNNFYREWLSYIDKELKELS